MDGGDDGMGDSDSLGAPDVVVGVATPLIMKETQGVS